MVTIHQSAQPPMSQKCFFDLIGVLLVLVLYRISCQGTETEVLLGYKQERQTAYDTVGMMTETRD